MKIIEKNYIPQNFEKEISQKWKNEKVFSAHKNYKKPFTILLPPPNVTGMLHIGHALDTYLQDSILRYKKLAGYDVFYIAGMDHAGIATQSKVESVIYKQEGLTRHDLGRDKFIQRVWDWKEEYANKFREQWQALGLGLDYDRERFTLDNESNEAVNKVFIELYNRGLIYRDTKAINWDPVLKTAVSNIEVINKPTEQEMLYIKYPIQNSDEYLIVATVRPETMLSDVALIYNPNDLRYQKYADVKVEHPLTKKIIKLIPDEYVDLNFGTGLMKLSAHAEIDIDLIKKYNLEIHETIDVDGLINEPSSQFHGLSREEARKAIKEFLLNNNLIEKIENTVSNVGYSERSNAPVETLVMKQWFVKMDSLAQKILNDMDNRNGVKFYPPRFKEVLKTWMNNIRDWNISRQLWWGHQIPAWYKNDEIKVQVESPGDGWIQDSDVLDTWFSSGIAPFSFLGWPSKTKLLKKYYPTSLLVTGSDLVFFWVARMYFFGLEFMKEIPFKKVLYHGLVRDSQGRKMSKSLNNGVDPITLINEYGSDALRWYLITNSTPGQDINFNIEGVKKAWNLNNKIWNIARYIQMLPDDQNNENQADLWIHNNLVKLHQKIKKAMQNYETTIIGAEIEKFIYNLFSSSYVELLKIKANKKAALANLQKLLFIIHPFLPFISDYIHQSIFGKEILSLNSQKIDLTKKVENVTNIDLLIELIYALRKYREVNNINKKEVIRFWVEHGLNEYELDVIMKLANAELKQNNDFLITENALQIYIQTSNELKQKYLDILKEKIDFTKKEIARAENMLNNPNFVAKAPESKIMLEKQKLAMHKENLAAYENELENKK
ncbi:valine--tRNA ligase [Mycoplasmopsis gallinarum]|uniref:Valine--tRNA ligase n=1 Tax=Mycoplasmopsis gallinarum TaxID=29557 RepID=A0A168RGQ3_9BACT|nr:valine--tRNA ligase [Mycoplasmopsis gallinarum]OAB48969.1 Valyl-tRNA synthetase [Mycoplasmopsis gallinarum]